MRFFYPCSFFQVNDEYKFWTFDKFIDIMLFDENSHSTENTQTGIWGELTWGSGHLGSHPNPKLIHTFVVKTDSQSGRNLQTNTLC